MRNHDFSATATYGDFSFFSYIFFYFAFVYIELIIRAFTVDTFFSIGLLYLCLIAFIPAFIFGLLTSLGSKKLQHILTVIFLVILAIYASAQLVVYHIFSFYISVSAFTLAEQAASYYREALIGIAQSAVPILLTLVPLILYIICHIIQKKEETEIFVLRHIRKPKRTILSLLLIPIASFAIFICCLFIGDKETYSPYDLYFNKNDMDASIPAFGLTASATLDVTHTIFGFEAKDSYTLANVEIPETDTEEIPEEVNEDIAPIEEEVVPAEPTFNQIDIDFDSLIANESDETLLQLHNYFKELAPTNQNDKTGIYEGYNLIYITAEAFSPYAVDPVLTPTLYKMANTGYVFTNYYTTGDWYTSTSDGEFMMCTGLLPMSEKNTFKKTATNYFAFSLANLVKRLGYSSATAFHNNSGTVYDRHLSHPNLGYKFISNGDGMDLEGWPESDLEMMEVTVPMYVGDTPFHAYYMTVSGHLNYNYSGNAQAKKHRKEVEAANLPYSEACQAYIACNMELDKAMENLLAQLETAGVADKTLIVMGADHYPYGLTDEQISEFLHHEVETTFERYHSTLIIYTPGKTDTEVIEKPCCAIDVLPTVANMMGFEYDSRLLIGQDIFSDATSLVIFPSRSFITDDYMFKWKGKEVIPTGDRAEIPEDEVKAMRKVVDNKFFVSSAILQNDYYRLIGLDTMLDGNIPTTNSATDSSSDSATNPATESTSEPSAETLTDVSEPTTE